MGLIGTLIGQPCYPDVVSADVGIDMQNLPHIKTDVPRITSVTYRRLRSFGSYENEAVEATCHVPEGADPEEALHATQLWVADQLGLGGERDKLKTEVGRLEVQKINLAGDVLHLEQRYRKACEFLRANKIDPDMPPPF